ncbi:Uncharacterised protein [Klebsiella pneumoniae]|nr:Uncharacterised protein [Klebsiella pneumoniae]
MPVIQQIDHRGDDRLCFELRYANELLNLHLVAGSVSLDGFLLAFYELFAPFISAGSWHDQQNVCHIRDLLPVFGPDILLHPLKIDLIQPGSVETSAFVIRPVVESKQAVNHVVTLIAINEVVNLVHERNLFLALGHDVMDDVHLFAVVDTGVRSKRLKDRKRCTHNFTI